MQEYTVKIDAYGTTSWFKPGTQTLHRLDGPAVEDVNGHKAWYHNGQLHRLDGPAVEDVNGHKAWYHNGQLHRLDGPAVEWANGTKFWYIEGRGYTEAEFNVKVNQVKELTVAEISELLGFEIKVVK